MVDRLIQGGHEIVAYDPVEKALKEAASKGAIPARTLQEMVEKLDAPRAVWIMVPSGKPTEETIDAVSLFLEKGDLIVDGGNSFYKDSIRRAEVLKEKGMALLDAGTSGGIWGLKIGYCLMVGGEKEAFEQVESIFKTLAPEDGYAQAIL